VKLLTSAEAGARLGISACQMRKLCKAGRVDGAVKYGRDWVIPESALALVTRRVGGWPAGRSRKKLQPEEPETECSPSRGLLGVCLNALRRRARGPQPVR